jgi:hypothetical protein
MPRISAVIEAFHSRGDLLTPRYVGIIGEHLTATTGALTDSDIRYKMTKILVDQYLATHP